MGKFFKRLSSYGKTLDWPLLVVTLCTLVYGYICVFFVHRAFFPSSRTVYTQLIAILVGLIAMFILARIDYGRLARLWKLYVPLALILVGLTFVIGIGTQQRVDDRAWLVLPGGVTIQPTEFMKLAFILSLSMHLSHVGERINRLPQVGLLLVHMFVPLVIIHLQGDDGTAVIFLCIALIMIFAAGISYKYVAVALGAAAVAAPVLWFFLLNADQRLRVLAIVTPGIDPQGIEYQQNQALISIGSGGLWGRGLTNPELRHIPVIQNDFILAFVGEALGLVGMLLVIVLLALLCGFILRAGLRSKDKLGLLICVGVFAMIASQAVINIGMCLKLLPVIGITLPFFSAGGSSMLTVLMGLGLVQSVKAHNRTALFFD